MQALQSEQYDCTKCSSVDEALLLLKDARYDVVISDVNMPGKDGLEFAKELRHQGHDSALLMISGEDFSRAKVNYLNSICLYADDVLGKPFTREKLLSVLEEVIQSRSLTGKFF